MRRRAVLIVEYTLKSNDVGTPIVPQEQRWERVWAGSGLADVRVEVQEDKAWP